jgi:hypothetical protein
MKHAKVFFDYRIIIVLVLFSTIYFGSTFLPARKSILDFFDGDGELLFILETTAILLGIAFQAYFFGLITDLLLRKIKTGEVSLFDSIKRTKLWFPRSMTAFFVGWSGIMIITFFVVQISSDALFSFLGAFLSGIWITLTFTFYPTMIASQKPIFRSIVEAFSINIRSVNRWFHWLLLLFFVSGGFTFLWVPEYWANSYLGIDHDYAGWMVHFQWLGGYSFQSYWYSDLTKWLFLNPPAIFTYLVIFTNISIATFIKMKVTQILFESEYFFESSKEVNNINVISNFKTPRPTSVS